LILPTATQSLQIVWHDPTAIQREVLLGTVVIVVSLVFSIFSIYSTVYRTRFRGYRKFVVLLGGWVVLFAFQLAYLASRATIIYGVAFNVTSGEIVYATTGNPMALPVAAVTILTAVTVIASLLIAHTREQYGRLTRLVYYREV